MENCFIGKYYFGKIRFGKRMFWKKNLLVKIDWFSVLGNIRQIHCFKTNGKCHIFLVLPTIIASENILGVTLMKDST